MKTLLKTVGALTLCTIAACAGESDASADKSNTTPSNAATSSDDAAARLTALIDSDDRPAKQKARDQYRRPLETLTFCGLEPDMTVVEIWPGGQGAWYRRIIEPFVTEGGGAYHAVGGKSPFPDEVAGIPYGEADMALIFRAHGFMIYDAPAQTHVDAVYDMVKPGGAMCIVDHAGDESVPQDPAGKNGYVNESHFQSMAEKAGFQLIATSDHNRNPKDTKDYPRGVWSLPPTLSRSLPGSADRKKYIEIGESDRFTHKYEKPAG
ncbi:MAG: methyltransferase [Pseudomonadota bacterium]